MECFNLFIHGGATALRREKRMKRREFDAAFCFYDRNLVLIVYGGEKKKRT